MIAFAALLRSHAATAWTVIVCAVLLRAIVPAGFMPMVSANGVAIVACPGMASAQHGNDASVDPMPGMVHHASPDHPQDKQPAPAKTDGLCAFAGLTAPSIGGANSVLLAIALAIVSAAALLQRPALGITPRGFLRPPLRGPPAPR